jgi:hypothetical protein
MIVHHFQDYTIQVFNECSYNYGSADNATRYRKHHLSADSLDTQSSLVGVRIFRNDSEIDNCIIVSAGGATTVHSTSTLVDNEKLVICCSDSVFCLKLPDLDLLWTVNADLATCFQVFKVKSNYIIHGELLVTSLDAAGQINWQFGGVDIFVSNDGQEEFKMDLDGIVLTDFAGTKYKIDFSGRLLWQV